MSKIASAPLVGATEETVETYRPAQAGRVSGMRPALECKSPAALVWHYGVEATDCDRCS